MTDHCGGDHQFIPDDHGNASPQCRVHQVEHKQTLVAKHMTNVSCKVIGHDLPVALLCSKVEWSYGVALIFQWPWCILTLPQSMLHWERWIILSNYGPEPSNHPWAGGRWGRIVWTLTHLLALPMWCGTLEYYYVKGILKVDLFTFYKICN